MEYDSNEYWDICQRLEGRSMRISALVRPKTYKALKTICEEKGISMSSYINETVENAIKHDRLIKRRTV